MESLNFKVDVIGDGLAGRLAFAALQWRWPKLDLKLVISKKPRATNPTWCFHEADVQSESWIWLRRYVSKSWDGYDVKFPAHQRTLTSQYHSIQSESFFAQTDEAFSSNFLDAPRVSANLTVVCTGWPPLSKDAVVGWQKFVGLDLTLHEPHGLKRPILKDARVPQADGYRFFYSLPWSETSLLVEDTYYSNSSDLDTDRVREEILNYAKVQGWRVKSVDRQEVGSLPLAFSHNDFLVDASSPSISLGAASGLAHPVTGYTTSTLLRQIESLVGGEPEGAPRKEFDVPSMLARWQTENQEIQDGFSYFHLLNRMLFLAAAPEKRFRVLERFYRLSPDLISRFYSARLTALDRARILIGRPPVPLMAAVREWRQWRHA